MEQKPGPDKPRRINRDVVALLLFVLIGVPVAYVVLWILFAAFVPARLE